MFSVVVSVVFNINCTTVLLLFIEANCACGPWTIRDGKINASMLLNTAARKHAKCLFRYAY